MYETDCEAGSERPLKDNSVVVELGAASEVSPIEPIRDEDAAVEYSKHSCANSAVFAILESTLCKSKRGQEGLTVSARNSTKQKMSARNTDFMMRAHVI